MDDCRLLESDSTLRRRNAPYWDPLVEAQRFIPETLVSTHFPDGNYRDAMARYAERIIKDARGAEARFASLSARIIGTPDPEIPAFMTGLTVIVGPALASCP